MSLNFKKVNIFSSTYSLITREQISAATSIPVTIVLPIEEAPEARSTGPQITEVGPSLSDILSTSDSASVIPPTFAEVRDLLGLGLDEPLVLEDPEDPEGRFGYKDFFDKLGDGGILEGGPSTTASRIPERI